MGKRKAKGGIEAAAGRQIRCRRLAVVWLALGIMLAVTSCGSEQGSRFGINGYVYIPRMIDGGADGDDGQLVWTNNSAPEVLKSQGIFYIMCSIRRTAEWDL